MEESRLEDVPTGMKESQLYLHEIVQNKSWGFSMAKGDHIQTFRWYYRHHGIDVGDGTVIHFAGEPGEKTDATVKRTSMEEFLNGGVLTTVYYSRCFPPDEVVQRAMSQLGRGEYNVVFNNCEHFATWCKTGFGESKQVELAAEAVASILDSVLMDGLTHTNPRSGPFKTAFEGYKSIKELIKKIN